jgi:hypothetical protein
MDRCGGEGGDGKAPVTMTENATIGVQATPASLESYRRVLLIEIHHAYKMRGIGGGCVPTNSDEPRRGQLTQRRRQETVRFFCADCGDGTELNQSMAWLASIEAATKGTRLPSRYEISLLNLVGED